MSEPDSVETIVHVTDHVPRAVARMTQKYAAKAMLAAFAAALFEQLQDVEDAFWGLVAFSLENAQGQGLDRIGAAVLFGRDGLEDEPYRLILRAWIQACRSSGTGPEILAVMATMLGGYGTFSMQETHRASMLLRPNIPAPYYGAMIRVLQRAKVGGVRIQLLYFSSPNRFSFAPERLLPQSIAGRGFGGLTVDGLPDSSVGGVWAGVIE
jgi:hypothetical protein